ncbi:MAG: hypothetical protein GX075_11580 [Firmicutes bacterium]|nr:hypothetical protein [Bacillota bacterium]
MHQIIYVADSGNYCIQKFDADGNFLTKWTTYDSNYEPTQTEITPTGIAVDSSGKVYVTDWLNNKVYRYDPAP